MTAMPQMVALFNGVGGGAVALVAFVEYRDELELLGRNPELEKLVPILLAAIIGSVSFWGSNIAFGKLQEILPGRPIQLPGQQIVNIVLLLVVVGCAVAIAAGTESELLFLAILVGAAILGNMFVLPIGGADMPVVISLLNAFTGLSAAAAGMALDNVALIVAGMLVGASGSILTAQMAEAMNRSIPNIVAGGFGGVTTAPSAADGEQRPVRSPEPRTWPCSWLTPRRSWSRPDTAWPWLRPSTPCASWPSSWRSAASRWITRSTPWPAACRGT